MLLQVAASGCFYPNWYY